MPRQDFLSAVMEPKVMIAHYLGALFVGISQIELSIIAAN
jgi:hypothetical protein